MQPELIVCRRRTLWDKTADFIVGVLFGFAIASVLLQINEYHRRNERWSPSASTQAYRAASRQ